MHWLPIISFCYTIYLLQSPASAMRRIPSPKVLDLLKDKRQTIPRIVGGEPLTKLEFPWLASLQYKNQHFCGATLIRKNWAITAAHCVDSTSYQPFEIVAGAHSLKDKEPTERRLTHKLIIVHEKWNKTSLTDDIALIKLKESMDLEGSDKHIKSIDLPEDNLTLYSGHECTAIGWGKISSESDVVSDIPMKVVLPLVALQECSRLYLLQKDIFKTNICAGGSKGKGICNGDSGGPLNCMVNGKWTYVGLDSFTVPCGVRGYPSVFTRIDQYNNWIRTKIAENDGF